MEHRRDEAAEEVLGDIIANGGDVMSYLNESDGLEGEGEAGYGYRTTEEEGYDYDGSSDRMLVQEGDRDDGSGDRTESGQVYILINPVLTRCIHCFGMYT